jgi:2-C-methyl-D-erythritol 4-phosphate cytidylyltransferase
LNYWLVVPAAGSGRRFGDERPKQYASLAGRTVIEWALDPFLADARCAGAVVAVAAEDQSWADVRRRLAMRARVPILDVIGGAQRADSVATALDRVAGLAAADGWAMVHDAARPCVARRDVDRLIDASLAGAGGLLAAPVVDTLKRAVGEVAAGETGEVEATVARATLWRALTPQLFRIGVLRAALDAARNAGRVPTDECEALEWQGQRPALVPGAATNIKITTPADLLLAAALLGTPGTGA